MAPPGSTAMRRRSVNGQAPSLTPIAVASSVAAHFDVGPRGTGSWFDVPDRRAAGAPTPDNEGGRHETLTRSADPSAAVPRSEEHTSELQSRFDLVCRRDLHHFPTRRSSDLSIGKRPD